MTQKIKVALNTAALSKKYKCDVNRLIRLWKKGRSDFEISHNIGVDVMKILQVRQEITYLHERERQQKGRLNVEQRTIFTHNPR